jgi:transcriptional regulator with XRE-family HTH domain
MAEPAETFGRRVKRLREAFRMTQEDLAERCGLGVTTIRDLERGHTTFPQEATVEVLADGLGLKGRDRDLFVASAPKRARARQHGAPRPSVPVPDPRASGGHSAHPLALSLPPRTPVLAGREELLDNLAEALNSVVGPWPGIVVLSGLGGVGKTTVAAEHAYRHLAGSTIAWQLSAEDRTTLLAGLEKLTAQLGVQDLVGAQDPVAAVHGVLARWPGRWLLIFDNALDQQSVQGLLPPAGHGQILITSQSPLWPRTQVMEVPVLGLEAAGQFLLDRTGDRDRQAAYALAEVLGGLPLALEQAAAHMQATGRSIASYLAMYRERRDDLLARGQPGGYDKLVTTTWTLAFDQLRRSAPAAIGLLRLLACFAPDQIPLDLLLRRPPAGWPGPAEIEPLLADRLAADDAVAALRRFSLIGPPRDGNVSVHRLVRAVTLSQVPADQAERWREAAQRLIEGALPDDPAAPGSWPVYSALLPHAQVVLPPDNESLAKVSSFLAHSGSYAAARDLQRQIVTATQDALGAENPATVAARASLARWTGQAGDFAGARDQLASLLAVCERALGPEHPTTLAIRADVAEWTGQAGDPAAARDQYTLLLPALEHVLGAEHPDTLMARADLAYMTGLAGSPAEARDQYAALLDVRSRVSGAEHPDTLMIRAELASATGQAGDPASARDQYAELLPILVRVVGAEHPDTLITRANLAHMTGLAGDPAAARDQYAELLATRSRVSGPEHPETLTVRANLARWTAQAGDPAGAREQLAALAAVRGRGGGPPPPPAP